jgi:hypothetical protein
MKRLLLSLALGVFAAGSVRAQAPQTIVNGQVDSRSVRSGLARVVDERAAEPTAAWIGYAVDGIDGDRSVCEGCGQGRCGTVYLEGRRRGTPAAARAGATRPMMVLLRTEAGRVLRIRVHQADCDADAGGLPVHWLTDVDPAESIAMLSRYVKAPDTGPGATAPGAESALTAIALHAAPAATAALERFVSAGQPAQARKRAAFWLGATRGAQGFAALARLADTDPDDGFRKELTFAVSVSREPGAVDLLIRMAKNDASGSVRQQAIFWLGQKAGERVAGTLADTASRDPETAVKERAVFALSRMPNGEGVPKLIEVARTNGDAAVRKRAVFWLGQSKDPRALDYLLEVLKR